MQKKIFSIFLSFSCLTCFSLFANNSSGKPDSLLKELRATKTDTGKITLLLKLASIYADIDIKMAVSYMDEAVGLSEKNPGQEHRVFFMQGKIQEASGELANAMTNYLKALSYAEKIKGAEEDMAKIFDRIGGVYVLQQNYKQAIKYRKSAIELSAKIKDTEGVAISTFNLGNIYYYMNDLDQAVEKYQEALPLFEKLSAVQYMDAAFNNIGAIYFTKKEYAKALTYFKKSYESRVKTNNLIDIASSLNNVGETYAKLEKTDSAIKYCQQAFDMSEKSGLYELIIPASQNLAMLFEAKNDFKTASYYHKIHAATKDSIFNSESQKQLQEMSAKYESEKKEKENEILNLQLKNESFIKYILIIVAGLILVVSLFIYRGYRQKKSANIILFEKNKIIEEQHKDITDSIKYAQRIQQAILPPDKMWFELLPDSFILYKPKDILSGDFYWVERKQGHIFVAAADCTGHGVPGAIMSVVNTNLLNKAVLEQHLVKPSAILDAVNQWLTIALHQSFNESAVRDGMDIALCSINMKTKHLQFAGAFNGVYLFKKDGSFIELNGDKMPVGAFIEEKMQQFSGTEMNLEEGDRLYIFSDGYADQFGGPKGKKMKYKKLKQYMEESLHMNMADQKKYLDTKFEEWRGNYEQVDDVLVVGIQI